MPAPRVPELVREREPLARRVSWLPFTHSSDPLQHAPATPSGIAATITG